MRVDGRGGFRVKINEKNMSVEFLTVFFLYVVNQRLESTHGMATAVFWRTFQNEGKFSEAW
jgi:hypothetical protein